LSTRDANREKWSNPVGSPLDPPQAPIYPSPQPESTDPGMIGNPFYPQPPLGSIPNPTKPK
jgi:hypothetical protein